MKGMEISKRRDGSGWKQSLLLYLANIFFFEKSAWYILLSILPISTYTSPCLSLKINPTYWKTSNTLTPMRVGALTFVCWADFYISAILFGRRPLFFVILDDWLGGGVVDGELLGDLSDNSGSYVDDTDSFLNIAKEFLPHLLSHFFVTLSGQAVLHE